MKVREKSESSLLRLFWLYFITQNDLTEVQFTTYVYTTDPGVSAANLLIFYAYIQMIQEFRNQMEQHTVQSHHVYIRVHLHAIAHSCTYTNTQTNTHMH